MREYIGSRRRVLAVLEFHKLELLRSRAADGVTIIVIVLIAIAVTQLVSTLVALLYAVSIGRRETLRGQTDELRLNTINNTLVNAAYQSDEVRRRHLPLQRDDAQRTWASRRSTRTS